MSYIPQSPAGRLAMRSFVRSFEARERKRAWLVRIASRSSLALGVVLPIFASGCTSALWDKDTFARCYRPAEPANLHLFYSEKRKDILVVYDEARDGDVMARLRGYWLEPNAERVNSERKPHFVSPKAADGLAQIRAGPVLASAPEPGISELTAVPRPEENSFTLYSGGDELGQYKLPTYSGKSQKVKQVLLTPFAVVVDATLVGAVAGYYAAPGILSGLSR